MPDFLKTPSGRNIAYHKTEGTGPGVIFLGGFVSDMQGTKAVHLEDWAKSTGRTFLRFDYSGHGESSEDFANGSIGDWARDAQDVVEHLTTGPQVLVGSSMGGWISLLLAQRIPDRIGGLVGIAAAPDFTEDSMWGEFSEDQRQHILADGHISIPSDYGAPYIITRKLIEDGRDNLVLRQPMPLNFPVRFLQGTADVDVLPEVALRLLDHATGDDISLRLVKGADHRFSTPDCLDMITAATEEILARISADAV